MCWTNHPIHYHCPPSSHSASSAKNSDWIHVNEQGFLSIQNRCTMHITRRDQLFHGGLTFKMSLSKCQPLSFFFFILGKRLRSERAKSGKQGCCWLGSNPHSWRAAIISQDLWAGRLSWWRSTHLASFPRQILWFFFNSCLKRSACSAHVIM